MEKQIYKCEICGKIVGLIHDGGGELVCCGEPMQLLNANTTDAAQEKHVPAVSVEGNVLTVKVGSVEHPMTPEHYIQWIMVTQGTHTQRAELTPSDKPAASFIIDPAKPYAVYEYCNLHGLWKKEG